jgi:maltose O-acetyltransferase
VGIALGIRSYLTELAFSIPSSMWIPDAVRGWLFRILGCKIGKGTVVRSRVFIGSNRVSLGDHCAVNIFSFLDGAGSLRIGDCVRIGPYARILTVGHSIYPASIRRHPEDTVMETTTIGRGCWIGMGAQIMPGVTVEEGCVIAAGSVLTDNTTPNGLYAGVPARRIKDLPIESSAQVEIERFFGNSSGIRRM